MSEKSTQSSQSSVGGNPAKWRVDEVFKSPTEVLIRISVANYITKGEAWPKVGEELKVSHE